MEPRRLTKERMNQAFKQKRTPSPKKTQPKKRRQK